MPRENLLTTEERQQQVKQAIRNLETQKLTAELDAEINEANGAVEVAEGHKRRAQQFASGIAAIEARWRSLLAWKPPAGKKKEGDK